MSHMIPLRSYAPVPTAESGMQGINLEPAGQWKTGSGCPIIC